jgi:hydrogenase maturation protease
MGNTILSDDGAGIRAAEKLQEVLHENKSITIEVTSWGGLRIIDLLSGYDSAIIIDAIKTGSFPPGYIHKFDYADIIHSVRMVSFHDVNFASAVELARMLDIPMPNNIIVYAIEIENADYFSETLSPKVSNAVNECCEKIIQDIRQREKPKVKCEFEFEDII